VGPDKLRFDFTHGRRLSDEELADVEEEVNRWILGDLPVHALTTTLSEARRLGAMALFGEKYGDVVRMVEVGDGSFSRELCGGTHVRFTAEIGVFKVVAETSSAANVRRIEAITGPAAITLLRHHDRALNAAGEALRISPERVPDVVQELRTRVRELERGERTAPASVDVEELSSSAVDYDGAVILVREVPVPDGKALLDLVDRLKGKLPDAAIVLGSSAEDRVNLVASVAPSLVSRGIRANEIITAAAQVVGGGGGGRDTLARAGGRDTAKLGEAIEVARQTLETALGGSH
jgi:alanyl-tRNA synthetase